MRKRALTAVLIVLLGLSTSLAFAERDREAFCRADQSQAKLHHLSDGRRLSTRA
jgi:hypothetical protein